MKVKGRIYSLGEKKSSPTSLPYIILQPSKDKVAGCGFEKSQDTGELGFHLNGQSIYAEGCKYYMWYNNASICINELKALIKRLQFPPAL